MANIIEGFRLAPQQQQLWSSNAGTARRRAACALLLEGEVNVERLREALREAVKRHSILRTSYHLPAGLKLPIQVVSEESDISWTEADLTAEVAAEQASGFERRWQSELEDNEDEERSAPVRASLLRLSTGRHILIISLHALSADNVTLENLAVEVSNLYDANSAPEKLADEPVQYLQFSEWQNELLASEEASQGVAYWRGRDFTTSEALALPLAKPSDTLAEHSPACCEVEIDATTLGRLEAVAADLQMSVQVILLASWQTLLHRLTNRDDITINTHFDGRKFEELREAFGVFARWLPLNCQVDANLRLTELLSRVEEAAREASEWQEFFTSHDESETANENPSLSVGFEYLTLLAPTHAGGLTFSLYRQHTPGMPFTVKLRCVRRDDSLVAEFHYDANRYDEASISRVAGYFRTLVADVVRDPSRAVCDLEILSEAERRQLTREWNHTAATYPHELCLHELLEAQVEATPDSIAVVSESGQLSYAELNTKANQLARYLQRAGVGPESRVGILLERSTEMMIAVLGVLKAGAAYVPLEAEYPFERLSFMLKDARVSVLLTRAGLRDELRSEVEREIRLDEDWPHVEVENGTNLGRTAAPDNLAYIIYTSGSTGTPKGAMIFHRGVVNYLTWAAKAYDAAAGSGAPVHSPLGFDLTVTSLFVPLTVGQRVWMLPESQGITALSASLHAGRDFSLVKLTPSHLELLGQMLPAAETAGRVGAFIVGGETLTGEMLNFWTVNAPETRVVNEYGPTETVVGCCVYEVTAGSAPRGPISIGKPIANMQMYVLDERLRPVPVGVTGELYIGGAGVARGYANQPALTAEKFIPHPFSDEPGARIYRTGDIGRYLPDGNIEFQGRRDSQVKIRGFRIELGEIEAVLRQHEDVREAVVVAREAQDGDKRLVAYVVNQPQTAPGVDELRRYLKEKLPEHMIPSAFVRLDELPLTHNGKVDRRKLPEPESVRSHSAASYAPPQSELESVIAHIWQEVLRVEKVGVHDNFFDLGGHSFLVLEVSRRLKESFGDEVTLMDMFNYPTVSLLAKHLSREEDEAPAMQESQSRADTRKDRLRRQRQQRAQNRVAIK